MHQQPYAQGRLVARLGKRMATRTFPYSAFVEYLFEKDRSFERRVGLVINVPYNFIGYSMLACLFGNVKYYRFDSRRTKGESSAKESCKGLRKKGKKGKKPRATPLRKKGRCAGFMQRLSTAARRRILSPPKCPLP
jgi:hypothetical protein